MEKLIRHSSTEVAEYRRGVSIREVASGLLGRFFPASVISLGGIAAASAALGSVSVTSLFGLVGGLLVPTGIGFGAGLVALGRWLYPDAKVGGRRSALAGLLAPLLPLGFFRFTAGSGLVLQAWQMQAIFFLAGIAVALTMFFPWLTPTPEHMREGADLEDEDGSVEKLLGGAP